VDPIEALGVLSVEAMKFARGSHAELSSLVDESVHLQVVGPSGSEFQVEVSAAWDDNLGKLCASSFLSTMVAFEHSCHLLAERAFHPARFSMASYTDA